MDFQTLERIEALKKDMKELQKQNESIIKQMLNLVDATQKGFHILNEELTRIAKLP